MSKKTPKKQEKGEESLRIGELVLCSHTFNTESLSKIALELLSNESVRAYLGLCESKKVKGFYSS